MSYIPKVITEKMIAVAPAVGTCKNYEEAKLLGLFFERMVSKSYYVYEISDPICRAICVDDGKPQIVSFRLDITHRYGVTIPGELVPMNGIKPGKKTIKKYLHTLKQHAVIKLLQNLDKEAICHYEGQYLKRRTSV